MGLLGILSRSMKWGLLPGKYSIALFRCEKVLKTLWDSHDIFCMKYCNRSLGKGLFMSNSTNAM